MCKDGVCTPALHSFLIYQVVQKLLILFDFVLPIQQDTNKGFILQQEVPALELATFSSYIKTLLVLFAVWYLGYSLSRNTAYQPGDALQ